jgi:hypothetical protein
MPMSPTHQFRDRGGRLIGAEPEMDALKEIPRRNGVSDAASVLGAYPHSRQQFVALSFHCAANVGRAQNELGRRWLPGSVRRRPLETVVVRRCPRAPKGCDLSHIAI